MEFMGYHEIFLAIVCFLFLHRLCRSWVDGPLPNWPLFGMFPSLLLHINRFHDWTTEILEQNCSTLLFKGPWLSNMDVLFTADPANIHHIFSLNFSNYPKGPGFTDAFDIFGKAIFNSDSDWWRTQRAIAHGLLNHIRFRRYVEKISQETVEKGLIPILEHVSQQGQVVDIQDVLKRFTFDSMCLMICGIDPGCLSIEFPNVPFANALEDAEEAILWRHVLPEQLWKFQRWLGVGKEKKFSRAWETIDHILDQYITSRREQLHDRPRKEEGIEEEEGVDLLTSYMEAEDVREFSKSDKYLRDTVLSLLLAGRDTTSATLTWLLWIISKSPSIESKIVEELKANLPTNEVGKWRLFDNPKELSGLVYLHGALCEALRLFPAVPFEHKNPISPDVLPSGHTVEPHTKIYFSFYSMGRMESIWGKDCLEFKPERWISESGEIKHVPSYKFPAFNVGPRTCLGKRIAFTQMKAVAANFIYNYRLEVVKDHLVSPSFSIILFMKHGLMARVKKRWI